MTADNARITLRVPLGYPTGLVYMDESGSRAQGPIFVMSAVKLRRAGDLSRSLTTVRERNNFRGEFKFSEVTKGTMCAYFDAIDQLADSDAHVAACVVDKSVFDPFRGREQWDAHADLAAQLLRGCINRRELVSVVLDGISTPVGVALDEEVKLRVNRSFRSIAVVAASCQDSRSTDLLQIADLAAGAVAFERKKALGLSGSTRPSDSSPKAKVAARFSAAFGCSDGQDIRDARINVLTLRGPRGSNVTAITTRRSVSPTG